MEYLEIHSDPPLEHYGEKGREEQSQKGHRKSSKAMGANVLTSDDDGGFAIIDRPSQAKRLVV